MNKLNKNIIIISFYAFPCCTVAALRTSLLANYLSNKGFDINFIRADDIYYNKNVDYDLKLDNSIKQHLILIKNNKNQFIFKIKYSYQVFKIVKILIKKNRNSIIYFSCDPFWYLFLGIIFKIFYNIPYIIDFRDIFYRHKYFNLQGYNNVLKKYLIKITERFLIKYSNYIIDVTEENSELHKIIYRKFNSNKFLYVLNGYNSNIIKSINLNDNINLSDELKQRKLKLAIAGKFFYYNQRSIEILKELDISEVNLSSIIDILIIGEEIEILREKLKNLKYIRLNLLPPMAQNKVIDLIKESDIFLLNFDRKTGLGTKVFDYIALNKPIFAFLEEDFLLWKFLNKFENSFLIKNVNDLINSLKIIIYKNITYLSKNIELIKKYSREEQYSKILDIL